MRKLEFKNQYKKLTKNIVIAVVLAIGVSGVASYLSASDKKINTVEIAYNRIIPVEQFEEPIIGEKTVKKPLAENVGNVDCYVRAKILLSDSRAESYIEYYYEDTSGFNYKDWVEDESGWLYYTSVLRVGEFTAPIFDHIKLLDAIPKEIDDVNIDVIFESVQCEGFSDSIEAFSAIS